MRRRDFITVLGGAAAWPLAPRAQPSARPRRIGFFSGASRASAASVLAGFPEGMRELGYVEDRDFVIEWRFAEGHYERFDDFAREMVRHNVDVIVLATTAAVPALQRVTKTIPIVLGYSADPVGSGFVASLARPGGNITGLASLIEETTAKQLELLLATAPQASRIGVISNPGNPTAAPMLRAVGAFTQTLGMHVRRLDVRTPADIDHAFEAMGRERIDAVIVAPDALLHAHSRKVGELTLRGRLVSVFAQREYVEHGGLMAYGERLFDFFKRSAVFVDKILKGAAPSDLPIEQPTRFYLTINIRTANVLRLSIPPTLLARADEVIE
jgi:putative ABC transport system substrate-binding protein